MVEMAGAGLTLTAGDCLFTCHSQRLLFGRLVYLRVYMEGLNQPCDVFFVEKGYCRKDTTKWNRAEVALRVLAIAIRLREAAWTAVSCSEVK